MAKFLKPKDKLRLILAGFGDLFEDIADAGGLMSFSYSQIYGYYPKKYKKSNFQNLVWRNLKTGEIEKTKVNGMPCLRLTAKGKEKLIRDFSFLSLQKKKWDGFFTQASYDIEEASKKTRNLWREKLKELNFGQLQKSVYVSPFNLSDDLCEFVQERKLTGKVYISQVKFVAVDPKEIAYKAWPLEDLDESYQKLLDDWEDEKFEPQEFLTQYFDILFMDPHLPRELLPDNWPGFVLQKIARKIQQQQKNFFD